jgi:hypothetical protein
MFGNIDWKWLIIGLLLAWIVIPLILRAVSSRKKA